MSKSSDDAGDLLTKIIEFAKENPVKFVMIASFLSMAAIPLTTFVGYIFTVVTASVVGGILLDAFIISLGAIGLGFVLCFVACFSMCCTSMFGAFYFGFQVTKGTLRKILDIFTKDKELFTSS